MENTATTPAPDFSPVVENPVEKLIRETFLEIVRSSPVLPSNGYGTTAWGPNEHDMARAIAAALLKAGHICEHPTFDTYGQCAKCGYDLIPTMRALPGLSEVERAVIENMAHSEPEPRPLTRKIGRVAYRRVNTLEIRRRALHGTINNMENPRNFDKAEYAALSFAIDFIRANFKAEEK